MPAYSSAVETIFPVIAIFFVTLKVFALLYSKPSKE